MKVPKSDGFIREIFAFIREKYIFSPTKMTYMDIRNFALFYYSLLVFDVFNLYRGTSQTYHCKDITTRMLVIC